MGHHLAPATFSPSSPCVSVQRRGRERDRGFTLIELLVVVIVIGLLAAIAIPVFLNQRKKGSDATLKADLKSAATAIESWSADNPMDRDGPADAGTALSNYTAGTDALASSIALSDGSVIKTSSGNFMEVYANSAGAGFCVATASTTGSNAWARPGRPGASEVRIYDSTAGGITSTPSAGCAYAGAAAAPAGWAASTNAVQCPQASAVYFEKDGSGISRYFAYVTIDPASVTPGATLRVSYYTFAYSSQITMTAQPTPGLYRATVDVSVSTTRQWLVTARLAGEWSLGCTQSVGFTTPAAHPPTGTNIAGTLASGPVNTLGNMTY